LRKPLDNQNRVVFGVIVRNYEFSRRQRLAGKAVKLPLDVFCAVASCQSDRDRHHSHLLPKERHNWIISRFVRKITKDKIEKLVNVLGYLRKRSDLRSRINRKNYHYHERTLVITTAGRSHKLERADNPMTYRGGWYNVDRLP